ncbi:MAG: hypothetical protein ABL893_03775, partial [Hyphomicrobium sp.]
TKNTKRYAKIERIANPRWLRTISATGRWRIARTVANFVKCIDVLTQLEKQCSEVPLVGAARKLILHLLSLQAFNIAPKLVEKSMHHALVWRLRERPLFILQLLDITPELDKHIVEAGIPRRRLDLLCAS